MINEGLYEMTCPHCAGTQQARLNHSVQLTRCTQCKKLLVLQVDVVEEQPNVFRSTVHVLRVESKEKAKLKVAV